MALLGFPGWAELQPGVLCWAGRAGGARSCFLSPCALLTPGIDPASGTEQGWETSPCSSHPCVLLLYPSPQPQGCTNLSCCSQPCEHHSIANSHCRIHSLLPWGNSSFMQGHTAQTPSLSCFPALKSRGKTDLGFVWPWLSLVAAESSREYPSQRVLVSPSLQTMLGATMQIKIS